MHFGTAAWSEALPLHEFLSVTHFRHPFAHSLQTGFGPELSRIVFSGHLSTHLPCGALILPAAQPMQYELCQKQPLQEESQGVALAMAFPLESHSKTFVLQGVQVPELS